MDPTRYEAMHHKLRLVNTVLVAVDADELAEFIEAARKADITGPYMDPTAWMEGGARLRTIIKMAELTASHRSELVKLTAQEDRDGSTGTV